jgi:hypothetical protein
MHSEAGAMPSSSEFIRQEESMSKREKKQGEQGGQPQPQQWPGKQGGQPGQQWPGKQGNQPEHKPTTWPTQPGQGH